MTLRRDGEKKEEDQETSEEKVDARGAGETLMKNTKEKNTQRARKGESYENKIENIRRRQ